MTMIAKQLAAYESALPASDALMKAYTDICTDAVNATIRCAVAEGAVYIPLGDFSDWMERHGIDQEAFRSWAMQEGVNLHHEGRSSCTYRVNGKSVRTIGIKLPDQEAANHEGR